MTMHVTTDGDNPYAPVIRSFFHQQFPTWDLSNRDLLEALTSAFLATNNLRYGPIPSPEVLVGIRDEIRGAILEQKSIPVLIPWGGRKADLRSGLDVAEVMAMRQIQDLQHRVTGFYAPGIKANIRLEDVNAYLLFESDGAAGRIAVAQYVEGMKALIEVLGMSDFLTPRPESSMFTEHEYMRTARLIEEPLATYLTMTDNMADEALHKTSMYEALKAEGWQGIIPTEQRIYYLKLYARLYPSAGHQENLARMARYFAGAWARHKLGGIGGKGIQIAFTPPVPGAPDGLFSKRVYYRTLPASMARTHIPGWRARGYLKISDSSVTPKLASFHDLPEGLEHCSVTLSSDDGISRVTVETPYVVVG